MNQLFRIIKNEFFWLAIILLIGFLVRLYKIESPVADWHSWRQADTASVARNFYKEGFNPFIPKYHDMSAVSGTKFNPERYRFVEFPISESIVFFGYLINGGVDEKIARLVSILFSLGSCIFVFFISKKYFGIIIGLIASFLYAILPYNIYFSRVILPEPSLVFFCLGMFYSTEKWLTENSKSTLFCSLLFGIAAFLTKPVAMFYLLPLGFLVIKDKRLWKNSWRYIIYLLVLFLPIILWRVWISQHPEGIPSSYWLLNGNNIRFRPAFWHWILVDRFGREILSVTGTILLTIGLLIRPQQKEGVLLHLLALSMFLYLIVFATGNVQHDYYQYLIVPVLVIFVARGFVVLLKGIPIFLPRIITTPIALLFLTLTIILTWQEVKGLYQINNSVIVEAGKRADQILPQSATVIAPYQADTAFLYQTNRHGFPSIPLLVDDLIRRFGITSYISVNYDAKTKWLMKKYTVLEANPKFVIIDLTKVNPNFYQTVSQDKALNEPL